MKGYLLPYAYIHQVAMDDDVPMCAEGHFYVKESKHTMQVHMYLISFIGKGR